ncbi:uncharacterized protein L969DRAFT_94464 [Mixia osmundae IAM 14324]|uniref:Inositol polyphosphate-related phosphatase domain-containing protein n=1 Tax=Mixia osmundae (strain CBS 9802 / IAM 14324 / JCM 22182 / KY 12970) TaxID=764103 RepID=G7E3J9_MIXOS|nr:uncharacterized protein L969DRAFT_94464 [Mixia osmundae IAM 14324]KEI39394.1 hypothetical protein L969DRAFT_94464 [Mixia osmundae IAM 14324]GAA97409.1 hypothetical protein E5Q_04087 [Mixia osmundae IAM 14324]
MDRRMSIDLISALQAKSSDYTIPETVSIQITSFNVANALPQPGQLDALFDKAARDVELHVLGLQEMDTSSEAMLRYTPHRSLAWSSALLAALNVNNATAEQYEQVAQVQLVGLWLVLFARPSFASALSEIETTTVPTGLLSVGGNKGASAIRLSIHKTPVLFVNVHLAAFAEAKERRHQDTLAIMRALSQRWPSTHQDASIDTVTTFYFGDLNYRIDLPREEIERLLAAGDNVLLAGFDQLSIERRAQRTLDGYEEGEFHRFRPTYKYDIASNDFDSSLKQRAPAWTDRILWQSARDVQLISYASRSDVILSDHKPVFARFQLSTEREDPTKRRATLDALLVEMNKLDNKILPDVSILPSQEVELDVRTKPRMRIAIQNTSPARANVAFKPVIEGETPFPDWLKVHPTSATLEVEERAEVELALDESTLDWTGLDIQSEAVLVLSIEGGRDIFVPVVAKRRQRA